MRGEQSHAVRRGENARGARARTAHPEVGVGESAIDQSRGGDPGIDRSIESPQPTGVRIVHLTIIGTIIVRGATDRAECEPRNREEPQPGRTHGDSVPSAGEAPEGLAPASPIPSFSTSISS